MAFEKEPYLSVERYKQHNNQYDNNSERSEAI